MIFLRFYHYISPNNILKLFHYIALGAVQRAPKMLHHFLRRFFDLTPPQPHCDYFIVMYFNKNWKTVYIISSVLKLNDSAESQSDYATLL